MVGQRLDIESLRRRLPEAGPYSEWVATRPYTDMFRAMNLKPIVGGILVDAPRQCGKSKYIAELMHQDPQSIYVCAHTGFSKSMSRNLGIPIDRCYSYRQMNYGGLRGREVSAIYFDEVNPEDCDIRSEVRPETPYMLMVTPPRAREHRLGIHGVLGQFVQYVKLPEGYITQLVTTTIEWPEGLFEL